MSGSLVLVSMPPTFGLVVFHKIFHSAFSTISISGLPSSATVSMKRKNSSLITESGSGVPRV